MQRKEYLVNILAPIVGLGVFVLTWYIVALAIGIELILPTPLDTLKGFFLLLAQKSFYKAVGTTLLRTLLSFIIAFVLASVVAFLSYNFKVFRKAFSPIAVIMRVLPTIAVILLVTIWFNGFTAPYFITFFVVFPMLYTTLLNAADSVSSELLEMGKVYRFTRMKTFCNIYFPQMLPSVLNGISITLSFCIKLTIAAEVISYTQDSMGRNMNLASAYLNTSMLLAWTLAAVLLGFALQGIVLLVKKLTRRYSHED